MGAGKAESALGMTDISVAGPLENAQNKNGPQPPIKDAEHNPDHSHPSRRGRLTPRRAGRTDNGEGGGQAPGGREPTPTTLRTPSAPSGPQALTNSRRVWGEHPGGASTPLDQLGVPFAPELSSEGGR